SVALMQTLDGGRHWALFASGLPNSGSAPWTSPSVAADSARLAVVQVDSTLTGTQVAGVLGMSAWFRVSPTASADGDPPTRPTLRIAGANPSRGRVTLDVGLPGATPIELEAYDIQGRLVRRLVSGVEPAGWHVVAWDGRDRAGNRAPPGIYLIRMR